MAFRAPIESLFFSLIKPNYGMIKKTSNNSKENKGILKFVVEGNINTKKMAINMIDKREILCGGLDDGIQRRALGISI